MLVRFQEELKNQLDKFVQEVEGDAQLGEEEKAERIKLEKMRIAMQKMKRAQFQQLVVKAVNADGSTKMAVVDEIMTAWDVCKLLVEKNRTQLGPNWTLIERLPSLQIGGLLVDFFFFFFYEVFVHEGLYNSVGQCTVGQGGVQ